MKLSVIVPVYNASEYLGACIQSLKENMDACSYETEVILVDDGSLDASPEICDKAALADNRFKVSHIVNEGVSNARNYGISKALGQYIMFLDADDYLADGVLEMMLGRASEDFIAYAYTTLYDDLSTKDEYFDFEGSNTDDLMTARKIMFASSRLNACWAKLFKKEIIDRYDLSFPKGMAVGEDACFVTEYFCKCKTYNFYQDKVLFYRQHEGSAMRLYDIEKRLGYTKTLYELSYEKVDGFNWQDNKKTFDEEMSLYYVRVLTNLFREYSKEQGEKLNNTYRILLEDSMTKMIIKKAAGIKMPVLKKFEYCLIKIKNVSLLKAYFKLKARA